MLSTLDVIAVITRSLSSPLSFTLLLRRFHHLVMVARQMGFLRHLVIIRLPFPLLGCPQFCALFSLHLYLSWPSSVLIRLLLLLRNLLVRGTRNFKFLVQNNCNLRLEEKNVTYSFFDFQNSSLIDPNSSPAGAAVSIHQDDLQSDRV